MLFSLAYAADVAEKSSGLAQFAPLILICVVFYFLLIRPQQRSARERKQMIMNLKIGKTVITDFGMIGTIKDIKLDQGLVSLEISNGVNIAVLSNVISSIVEKDDKKADIINKKDEDKSKKGKKKSAKKDSTKTKVNAKENAEKKEDNIIDKETEESKNDEK
jgi:preprotein translocase subunit YajC